MMYFETTCPHCSKHLKVAEEHEGKAALCPFCNQRIVLEREQESEPVQTTPPFTQPQQPASHNRNSTEPDDPTPRMSPHSGEEPVKEEVDDSVWSDQESEIPAQKVSRAPDRPVTTPSPVRRTDEVAHQTELTPDPAAAPHKYVGKPNGTSVSLIQAAAVAVILMAAWYGILVLPLRSTYLGELFLERGWVTYAISYLACWTASTLLLKTRKLRQQRKSLLFDLLPTGVSEEIRREDVKSFQAHIDELCGEKRHSFLIDRVKRALAYFKARGNVEEVSLMLNSQAELDAASVESSYTMVKVFIWAIPILGFIGTVLGISAAVSGFSGSIQTTQDLDIIKHALTSVTSNLAYAFDTTLVALVVSVVLMIPASSMQKREEDILSSVEGFCGEHLLQRLQGSQTEEVSMKAAICEALAEHDRADEWAQRLAEASESVTSAVVAGWTGIHTQLQQSQTEHVDQLREISQTICEERSSFAEQLNALRDSELGRLTGVVEAMAETADRIQGQVAEAQRQHAEQQKSVIVEFSETLGDLQRQAHQHHKDEADALQSLTTELAHNMRQVQQDTATIQEDFSGMLQAVTPSLTEGLERVASTVEGSLQAKFDSLDKVAQSVESQSSSLGTHLSEFQLVYTQATTDVVGALQDLLQQLPGRIVADQRALLDGLTDTSTSLVQHAAEIQEGVSAARSAIESTADVAKELHEVNDSARRNTDELTGRLDSIIAGQQQTTAVQRELAKRLRQMVTTESFGEMLSGMNESLRGLLAAVGYLEETTGQMAAERANNNGRQKRFVRSHAV